MLWGRRRVQPVRPESHEGVLEEGARDQIQIEFLESVAPLAGECHDDSRQGQAGGSHQYMGHTPEMLGHLVARDGMTNSGVSAREGLKTSPCKVSVPTIVCMDWAEGPARGKGGTKRDFALGAAAPVESSETITTDPVEGLSFECLVPGADLFGRDASDPSRVVPGMAPL